MDDSKQKAEGTSESQHKNNALVKRSYSEWEQSLVKMMKQYPLVHNKWRSSRFKKMYNNGLSVEEAFRCWICAH
jgi:hypothetical protein